MLLYAPFNKMQNVNLNRNKTALCQGEKMTLNTSFSGCMLVSREEQNCPSKAVII